MKKNTVVFLIVIAAFVISSLIAFLRQGEFAPNLNDTGALKNIEHLILTKHARCRMECRHISVMEIKGNIEKWQRELFQKR